MSQRVFGKPAKNLSLAESALIAGLARAPATLSPWSNLDGAIMRSHVVLARMRDEGFITDRQSSRRSARRFHVQPYRSQSEARHGYAKDYLRQRFRDEFGGDHPPDWRVDTTFVAALQDAAEARLKTASAAPASRCSRRRWWPSIPPTGNVLALVGGRDYQRSAFNRASRSRRQPGSAFKPFVFAAALERGFSPVSLLTGLIALPPQGPDEWTPRNVARRCAGSVDAARRADRIEQPCGDRVATAHWHWRVIWRRESGLGDLPDVPSLALGTGLVTPLA